LLPRSSEKIFDNRQKIFCPGLGDSLGVAVLVNPLLSCSRQKDLISFYRGGRGCLSGGWSSFLPLFLLFVPIIGWRAKLPVGGLSPAGDRFSIYPLFFFLFKHMMWGSASNSRNHSLLELTSSKISGHNPCIAWDRPLRLFVSSGIWMNSPLVSGSKL